MQNITAPQVLNTISKIVNENHYKKVILQLPKSLLSQSFSLTSSLRPLCPQDTEFYVLFDSLKKACCTDIIGSKHIDYDALFHFGYACFSEEYQKNHYFIMEEGEGWDGIEEKIKDEGFKDQLKKNEITVVICDQSVYERIKGIEGLFGEGVEVARLPFDQREGDSYLGFSYFSTKPLSNTNILIIKPDANVELPLSESPTSHLITENIALCRKSLNINNIYTLTPTEPITLFTANLNKRLMQRISQISELEKYTTFGILVSNPSTKFCQEQIKNCRNILNSKGLKHFTFMMNNLNEAKLGNFPEIEVYVVLSCYNYSLYGTKDFYRLVVTPYDLEVAFGEGSYEEYQFDLNAIKINEKNIEVGKEEKVEEKKVENAESTDVIKVNNQVMIHNAIQTLDFYRNREYKGLDFCEKKEVEKVKLGKIGIAEGYRPLTE